MPVIYDLLEHRYATTPVLKERGWGAKGAAKRLKAMLSAHCRSSPST